MHTVVPPQKRPASSNKDRERMPHLFNLNPDPQLTGNIAFVLKRGSTLLGNQNSKINDVTIVGPG